MPLQLVKYHGLGNDFLVLVDWERQVEIDVALAVALCDRHRGLGADGLLRVSAPRHGATLAMELRNADGGIAETSGNGLRCAALAAVHEGLSPGSELDIETLAGTSKVRVELGPAGGAEVRVAMGSLTVGPEVAASELQLGGDAPRAAREELVALGERSARRVEIGNPHLVILAKQSGASRPRALDVLGPALEDAVPGGVNVEVVAPLADGSGLGLDVWERGAGITLACGTGSCASAAAARASGIVGDVVRVVNPGGPLVVELSGDPLRPDAVLIGQAQRVGRAVVEVTELVAAVLGATDSLGSGSRGRA